jgi:endonuclease-3
MRAARRALSELKKGVSKLSQTTSIPCSLRTSAEIILSSPPEVRPRARTTEGLVFIVVALNDSSCWEVEIMAQKVAKSRIKKISDILRSTYPGVKTALGHTNPLELLIATILSAQCTDERVNRVTATLFQKLRTAKDFVEIPVSDLEEMVRPTGFYRNKAKSIKACCAALVERHEGKVPDNMEALVQLPGIGRKTANVVLGSAFGIPGIVVDTHVKRVSQRIGLTTEKDPVKIEFDLMALIPRKDWIDFSHQMIWHGRALCKARKPNCPACPLRDLCDDGRKAA